MRAALPWEEINPAWSHTGNCRRKRDAIMPRLRSMETSTRAAFPCHAMDGLGCRALPRVLEKRSPVANF
ncbi:hypothetical protein GUJ93_ZPchr0004g40293 [Zizania palustris]|uniref:Uncharacterized protein n=1 Tax=Zizania palustris TaxID=103762 RepID=A0A8J5SQL3_ZIZPA|nr:hypothetical protein GUJ93_ZPchr0004g40293 [Zizania palustris]